MSVSKSLPVKGIGYFSSIKSHFPNESINVNFVLALRYFENIGEAESAHYWKKDADSVMTSKKKNVQKKADSDLVFDSSRIQSCRLTCSFPKKLYCILPSNTLTLE